MTTEFNTSCKQCAFAHYIGKTQVSCDIGRLEKLRDKNAGIIEAEDHEKEFFVIPMMCTGYRPEAWAEAHRGTDLIEKMTEESTPRLGFIILLEEPKDKEQIFADIAASVKNIHDHLKYPPAYIVIVSNLLQEDLSYLDLIEAAQDIFLDYDVDYKVMRVTTETSSVLEVVDVGFINAQNGFYCVLRAGDPIVKNMDELLNHAINNELMNVGMVKDEDEISRMTVQSTLHKHLYGNHERTLESKIRYIQNEDGSEASIIYTWEQLSNVFTNSNSPAR